jgi:hypothetical protein
MDEIVFDGVTLPRPSTVGRGAWMTFWENIKNLKDVLDEIEEVDFDDEENSP